MEIRNGRITIGHVICYLAALLSLAACVEEPLIPTPYVDASVICVGDSNTMINRKGTTGLTACQQAGLAIDGVSGRKLLDINRLPPNAEKVFLAMGTNDAKTPGITPHIYGEHLKMLLGTTEATVYCILPVVHEDFAGYSVTAYQNKMYEKCDNVIDPRHYGVRVEFGDGIHYSSHADQEDDNDRLYPAIGERVN